MRLLPPPWRRPHLALAATAALALGIAVAVHLGLGRAPSYDLVITDATLVDGSGAPARYHVSIGVRRDRIVAIWRGPRWFHSRQLLDARSRIAAPGFIDTHSHADASVLAAEAPINAWNYVGQGVTTLVTGNCGRSPLHPAELASLIDRYGVNVNVATLIGHNTVKRAVMGARANDAPSKAQLARMRELVARAMRQGALGISTGLAYLPGRLSPPEEIEALLAEAARFGGLHASHVRDEGAAGLAALEEVMRLSREARIPLFISHLKVTGTGAAACGDFQRRQELIAAGRREGLIVGDDFYPYAASSTNLDPLLPDWYFAAEGGERRRLLRDPRQLRRLEAAVMAGLAAQGWQDFGFARVALAGGHPRWSGLRVPQIADLELGARGLDQQLRIVDQLVAGGEAQMIYHNICGEVMERIAADPGTMVGSDSAIRYRDTAYLPHPRGCGTFPRFLRRFVVEEEVLSWSQAIHRLTGLSAETFHLAGRGLLREGYHADIVIFDPARIRDRATYEHPLLLPDGIDDVLVNGQLVLDHGQLTSAMPGQMLRRGIDDSRHPTRPRARAARRRPPGALRAAGSPPAD